MVASGSGDADAMSVSKGVTVEVAEQIMSDDGRVYLMPTPTTDPADPLNWSPLRKWAVLLLLLVWSAVALTTQSFLSNFVPSLEARFPDASPNEINLLMTVIVPMIAPGQLIFVGIALYWGRRSSILLANMLLIASSAWAACSTSYKSLLGARIIEGLAGGPTDALLYTVIQEFTFAHERGAKLGAMIMGQQGLTLVLAIGTNYMAVNMGFQWPFIIVTIISACTLVGLFFLMPETRFRGHRDAEDNNTKIAVSEHKAFRQMINQSGEFPPFTWRRQLSLFGDRYDTRGPDTVAFAKRIGMFFFSPITWWCALLNAVSAGTIIANVGLINISPTVTSLFNWILLGWGNDKVMIYLAKRNGGVSKPEHRLVTLAIPIVIGICSTLGFGALSQNYLISNPGGHQAHWMSMMVLYGLLYMYFGGCLEVTYTYMASVTSASDSLALMTVVSVIRDMVSFGMSYGIVGFSEACGYLTSFGIYAMLGGVFGLFAIPVYLFAGRLRRVTGAEI
ncbi:hypothetical protein SCUCBS95973_001583 [Sporothrix curviconia]|uniref:Major facilitator superfamily (MFS) profile domain-containing protein n=1 Tax=Sporothrix curviconia TaxID=1260050 RepID=A0ABP0AZQ5_9PEZI